MSRVCLDEGMDVCGTGRREEGFRPGIIIYSIFIFKLAERRIVGKMVSLHIEDLKEFTRQLFIGDTFDRFLVREARIVTFNSFEIDGHIRGGYYSRDEAEARELEEFSFWSVLRPFCFSLIKGKRLPESFCLVFQLSGREKEKFMEGFHSRFSPEEVNGLYLNIRYEGKTLSCVTGTSVSRFTLDKTLEQEWDQAVKAFLKKKEIAFEIG